MERTDNPHKQGSLGRQDKRGRMALAGNGRHFPRSSVLYRVLIPYAAYTVIILAAYFILIEVLVFQHTKNVIEDAANRNLEQIYHTSDILLEHNFSYYYDVYYHEQSRKYMNAFEMTPNHYTEVIDYLLDCVGKDLITHSIYLYNEQLGIVFTSNGGAVPIGNFYDRDILDSFIEDGATDGASGRIISRQLEEKAGSSWNTANVISYCFQDEGLTPGKHIALLVNISQDKYQRLIGKKLEEDPVVTEVISPDGYLISGTAGTMGEKLSDEYVARILQSGREKGTLHYKDGSGKYYVSWQNSNYFGWIYVGKANYGELLSDFYAYNAIIIVAACFFILIGLFCSFLFTRKIYSPLQKLVSYMGRKGITKEDCGDEYEFLNMALKEMETKTNEMKGIEYRYHLKERNEIIRKLLHEDGYWEKNRKEVEQTGLLYSGTIYCAASFGFHHLDSLKAIYSQADMELFCFTIINVLEEYLRDRGYTAYGVEDEYFSVCVIIQLEDEYEKSEEYAKLTFPNENATVIQKLLYEAKEELQNILKPVTLFASVGRSVKGVEELHRSWLDTRYADRYRFIRGTDLIILYTAHMENYESGIPYPIDIEKQLLSNLKQAREKEMLQNLDSFLAAVAKMAPDEMRWAINQVMTSVFHVSMQNKYTMKDDSPLDWKNWTYEMNAADTKDEMREVFIRLLENLFVRKREDDVGSAKQRVAETVKEYVDRNFCVSTLSVAEIADWAGVSVNYARQVFKDTYAISVSDYILEKRIEKAKQLLQSTDLTSKSIGEMVGYTDNRYFYVVFKRKAGETAENFRRKRRLSLINDQEEKGDV